MGVSRSMVAAIVAFGVAAGAAVPVQAQSDPPPSDEASPAVEAVDDFVLIEPSEFVNIDVTGNDETPDSDSALTITINSAPQSGSASGGSEDGDEVVVYSPDDGFAGTDSFTYETCVDGSCDTAVVTVYVGTVGMSTLFGPFWPIESGPT